MSYQVDVTYIAILTLISFLLGWCGCYIYYRGKDYMRKRIVNNKLDYTQELFIGNIKCTIDKLDIVHNKEKIKDAIDEMKGGDNGA